jgi:hypothetical protein
MSAPVVLLTARIAERPVRTECDGRSASHRPGSSVDSRTSVLTVAPGRTVRAVASADLMGDEHYWCWGAARAIAAGPATTRLRPLPTGAVR